MRFILKYFVLMTTLCLAWHLQAYSTATLTRGHAETGTNDVTYIDIDDRGDDAISIGKRMLKAQMFDKALVHLNAALEKDPENHEGYFLRAIAHLLLSLSETDPFIVQTVSNNVLQDLDTSIMIEPGFTAALALRGSVYAKQGKLMKAGLDFEQIRTLEPVNVKDLAYLQILEPVAAELEHSKKLYSSRNNNTILYLLTKALIKRLGSLNQNVPTLQQLHEELILKSQELFKAFARTVVISRGYTKKTEFLLLEAINHLTPKMRRAIALVLEQDYHEAINAVVQALDECHDLVQNQEVLALLKHTQNVFTDIEDALDDVIELYREKDYKGAIKLLLERPLLRISRFEPKMGHYLQQVVQQLIPDLDDAIALFFVENDYQRACHLFSLALLKKFYSSKKQLSQFEDVIEAMSVVFHHYITTYTKLFSQWKNIYTLSKEMVGISFNLDKPIVLQYLLRTIQRLTVQIEQAKVLYNKQDYQGAMDLLSKALDKQLSASNEEVALYLHSIELLVAEFEYLMIMLGKPDYLKDINLLCMALIKRLYHFNQEASINLQTIALLSYAIEEGDAMYSRRDYLGAIDEFSITITTIEWDPHLLEMRAECYGALGDLPNALQDIRHSANLLSPGDSALEYLKISLLFYRIGDAAKLRLINECSKLDPDNKHCQIFYKNVKQVNLLLMEILDDGKWDDCDNKANEILEMKPNIFQSKLAALSNKCHCLTQGGYSSRAQMTCSKVLELDPDNENALCDKAENFKANKHYLAAIVLFRQILDINSTNRRAHEGIKHTKKLIKDLKEEMDYYKILGVERGANTKQIEIAYTKLSNKWNPDKFDTEEEKKQAEIKLMDIAAAKEVLTYQIMNDWHFEDMDMNELDDE